jgi:hypothetical protein
LPSASPQPRSILLVGSIPLASAEEVFSAVAGALGTLAPRIPDGETGDRLGWIAWTRIHLRTLPALEAIGKRGEPGPRFRIRDGARDIDLGPLQYAPVAIQSYAQFRALKAQGKIPAGTRFQVSLPTPFGIVFGLFPDSDLATIWRLYEQRTLAEIAALTAAIPAQELALQWDIAVETISVLADPDNKQGLTAEAVAQSIAQLSNAIPAAVELGLHICYGDRDHHHFIEPKDFGTATAFANRLFDLIQRPIGWLHLPVPKDRDDDAYFAPLDGLKPRTGTQLYLGLVHLGDGIEGATRRMAAASRFVKAYGIATECGLGRRPAETIPAVLALHRDIATLSI